MDAMSGMQDFDQQREIAQKLLGEAKKRLEAEFIVYPLVRHMSKAPTGEPYVQVLSGLIRREEPHPTRTTRTPLFATPEEAIAAWEEQAMIYATRFDPLAGEEPYTLYWRIPPEIDQWENQWKVYSRFLVSNKTVAGA